LWIVGYRGGELETICHVTPSAVVMVSVFLCFAAIAAAVDDEGLWVGDGHFEV